MIPIAKLRDKYRGRAGVVMGGGPSLEGDLVSIRRSTRLLDHRPIMISVNGHGLEFVQADYTVFLDDQQKENPKRWEQILTIGGTRVTGQLGDTDVDLRAADRWQGRYSGHLACWLACYLGCNPVLLCGMDCYQNPMPEGENPANWAYVTPLWEHLQWWQEAFLTCPHPVRIKAVSGPLVEVFGKWK